MKRTYAVKDIALFLYSSGDLTNEFFQNNSKQDGKKAHSFLQRQYNKDSKKEYYIKYTFKTHDDEITVHGFIDGVLNINGSIILEEIKSTKEDLKKIDLDYHKEHLAQLKLYGYLYAHLNNMSNINLRLTYISIYDYKTKSLDLNITFQELEEFFNKSIKDYTSWYQILYEASNLKLDTLKNVTFPFKTKRQGQMDLMKATYISMKSNSILYAIAPTGIGKTMAVIFSTLKSMTKHNEKLFYLTAKTVGKEVAIKSFELLVQNGLKIRVIALTAKQKSCQMHYDHCDPENCPFAKGYFSRLRDAIEDIYNNELIYTYDKILAYANKYTICSFEFALDLSYFCDAIICDYNYVFDPKAHLIRYFDEDEYQSKILVDEAHNLVDRSKEMYSARLDSNIPFFLEELISAYDSSITKNVKNFYKELEKYKELINDDLYYYSHFLDDVMLSSLKQIVSKCELVLSDNKDIKEKDDILKYYYLIKDFTDTSEYYEENHIFLIKQKEDKSYEITLKCCDASSYIYETIKLKTKGIVFFSATLFPINYYMDLLTKGNGKYINLPSPFDKDNLKLIIKDNVSTKYKDRANTVLDICSVINTLVNSKKGNYIAFFPSYKYIELVLENLEVSSTELIIQKSNMKDKEKENILEKFKDTKKAHLGLFVLGGSFSEGIDFEGDLLNGVIIVGVGLPMVNIENNILCNFFEEKYSKGFDYAYTYPGFNKIVQAAGRVIRTEYDRGVVILIDQRYKYRLYQELMPDFWSDRLYINNIKTISNIIDSFNEEDSNLLN